MSDGDWVTEDFDSYLFKYDTISISLKVELL